MTIIVDGEVRLDRDGINKYTLEENANGDVILMAKFPPTPIGDVPTGTMIDDRELRFLGFIGEDGLN